MCCPPRSTGPPCRSHTHTHKHTHTHIHTYTHTHRHIHTPPRTGRRARSAQRSARRVTYTATQHSVYVNVMHTHRSARRIQEGAGPVARTERFRDHCVGAVVPRGKVHQRKWKRPGTLGRPRDAVRDHASGRDGAPREPGTHVARRGVAAALHRRGPVRPDIT